MREGLRMLSRPQGQANEVQNMNAAEDDLFLTEEQVNKLTGIRRGDTINGVKYTKFQLQASFLRESAVPFIANARGKPVVTRAAVEGRREKEPARKGWQPKVVGG